MATPRLFILPPTTIFAARVNMATVTYPVSVLTFDTVTTGAYTDIRIGMTLLLGSAAGLDDLGRTRVRGTPTSTTIMVGRSSRGTRDGELDVSDNMYITVLNEYRVWSKIPYIDGAVIYKDSDIVFGDQTLNPPPVANAGPPKAATIASGTSLITVAFDGTASFAVDEGATITGYAWDIADGTVTVGTVTSSTLTVTFPAGFRYIALTVTDSNGNTHTTRRPIYARDPANDTTVDTFQIENHRITPQGQQVGLRILSSLPATTYPDGSLVILFDGEPASAADRTNLLFWGWIHTDPARIDAQRTGTLKDITLQCLDVAGKLDTLPGFPLIIQRATTPASWAEMANTNIDRFLHYLLYWHSTATEVTDWTNSGTGNTYPFLILGSEGDSLFDQVNRKCQSMIPDYKFTCNTLGQLMVKVDPMLQDTGSRTATIQVTLTGADYSDIRYTHQRPPRVHWLRASAIIASTTVVTPAFCVAPGEAPGQGGSEQTHGEQLAVSQTTLNATTGHRYARVNARQNLFNITLAQGSDLGIEPANMTWVRLTITAAIAAQRGLTLTTERGLVQEINIRYSHERTGLVRTADLTWERETSGTPAVTVTPAAADPVDDGDTWTPPPAAAPTVPEPIPETGVEIVAAISNLGTIWETANFQTTPPTWTRSLALAASFGTANEIYSFVVDPFSPLYRGLGSTVRGFVATENGIWRIDDIFGSPSATSLYTFDETGSNVEWWRTIAASFGRFEAVEANNPWIMVASYYYNTGVGPRQGVYTIFSRNAGATWSAALEEVNTVDPDPYVIPLANAPVTRPGLWLSPRTPGFAAVGAYEAAAAGGAYEIGAIFATTDWGDTWQQSTPVPFGSGNGMGGHLHIPWPDNEDESVGYNGYYLHVEDPPATWKLHWGLYRDGIDISPTNASIRYGPREGLFGIRSYDSDRRYMVLAGYGNSTTQLTEGGTNSRAAVFVSSDYGTTWTLVDGPYTSVGTNGVYPIQAAFGPDNRNTIFIWGNEGFIKYSTNFGSTWADKTIPTGGTDGWGGSEQMVGFCGGEA